MPTPTTIPARLIYARELYTGDNPPSLREIDRLCEPRLGLGHTQQIVAGDVKDPGTDTLRRIAVVLGCKVGWLSAGEGNAPSAEKVTAAVSKARRARAAQKEEERR